MEVVVTTAAIRHAKLQSNSHHQQTNTQFFFTGQMSFLSPNQQCQSTEGKAVVFGNVGVLSDSAAVQVFARVQRSGHGRRHVSLSRSDTDRESQPVFRYEC